MPRIRPGSSARSARIQGDRKGFKITDRDQPNPWASQSTSTSESFCIELSLVPNPHAELPHPIVAPISDHEWQVELVEGASPRDVAPKKKTKRRR